jgi:hypothetical protein
MTEAELSEVGWPTDRSRDSKRIGIEPLRLRLVFEMTGTLLMR